MKYAAIQILYKRVILNNSKKKQKTYLLILVIIICDNLFYAITKSKSWDPRWPILLAAKKRMRMREWGCVKFWVSKVEV